MRFWLFDSADTPDAALDVTAIACRLAFAKVYDKIEFAPETHTGELL